MLCVCVYAESITTANMSKRNTNSNRTSGRFEPSYKCLERSKKSPYSGQISDRTNDEVRKDPLSGYKAWPNRKVPKEEPVFIRMNKTLRVTANECLGEYEFNYVGVALRRVPYECKENQTTLEDMFLADPFGLKEVPTTDVLCWQIRSITTATDAGATGAGTASASIGASATAATVINPKTSDATRKGSRGKGGKVKLTRKQKKKQKKKKRREKRKAAKARDAAMMEAGEVAEAKAEATPETVVDSAEATAASDSTGVERLAAIVEETEEESSDPESSEENDVGGTGARQRPQSIYLLHSSQPQVDPGAMAISAATSIPCSNRAQRHSSSSSS